MTTPKMAEISKVLKKVGKPGDKLDQKKEAIAELFRKNGANPVNFQGFSVLDDLESYREY